MTPPPILVHISADFPDPFVSNKTHAIANLIDATPEFRHVVYSLNRVSAWSGIEALPFREDRIAVVYGAPRWGLMLSSRMRDLGAWIIHDLSRRNVLPDAVQAHKITVEGLAAEPIARYFNVPFLCSVQAKTDVKILRARPDLRRSYRRIWHDANHVFPFSPRAINTLSSVLHPRKGPTTLLPCITKQDDICPAALADRPSLVSMFRLDDFKGKNAGALIKAVLIARNRIPDLSLDIYGSGPPEAFFELARIIKQLSATDIVNLKGAVPHHDVQRTIARYTAFAMPTRRESYGMVFAESLLAGVPILQTRGWGLHGLFPDDGVGYACSDPGSPEEIATGLIFLVANEKALKNRIAAIQTAGTFEIMRQSTIANRYRKALESVLNKS
jgi:glycosyltransferase involved in cell wall biosynthesis